MSENTQTPEADENTNVENIEATDAAQEAATTEAESANPVDDEPEARIAELEVERDALKDQLVRTLADMENLRKRTEKQISDSRTYAVEKFAGDILSVSDNMSRALSVLNEDARESLSDLGKTLLEGVEMTQKELHAVLARHGVSAVDAAPGAAFDPNHHQAVTQIPSEHPAGTVAQTFQSGWKIGDRTLRAAMVAVSSGSPTVSETEQV